MSSQASEAFVPGRYTWLGLLLILGPALLPLVFHPVASARPSRHGPAEEFFNSVVMWALMAGIALIVTRPEKSSLASIGFRPIDYRSIGIGLVGAAILFPISELLLINFDS